MAVFRIFLVSLLLCLGSVTAFGQVSSAERAALIDFYLATGGDEWHDNTNWLADEGTECQWYGVRCSNAPDKNQVLWLDLPGNNLTGELPNSLDDLEGLWILNLSDNQLRGTIPETLWDISRLQYLILANNRLEGALSGAALGLARNQGALVDLSGNLLDSFSLAGVPTEPTAYTSGIRLADNLFSELPPPEWRETGNIGSLDLSRNGLEGTVAPGDLYWPRLGGLSLSGNTITELAELLSETLPDLRTLILADNHLGSLPSSLIDLPLLHTLDLGDNRLDGELPEWFVQLNLARLNLENNRLSGPIERVFKALGPYARVLHVANNQFSGPLPEFDFSVFNRPDQGQSPEFGLDLCFNAIELPDSETLAAIDKVHRGLALAPCIGRDQFPVDPTISGSWFQPERSGEGLTQMLLDSGQMLSYWFTYAPPADDLPPKQMWLFGLSEPSESRSEFRPLWITSGGQFDQGLGGGAPERSRAWMRQNRLDADNLHFFYDFYDYRGQSLCAPGLCSWDLLTGRHDQTRLTELAGATCENQNYLQQYSGAWYNPERSGEGFIIEVLPDYRAVLYWFTYQPDDSGKQAWMIGTGEIRHRTPLPPDPTRVQLIIDEVRQPVGAQFGPEFDPADVEMRPWGVVSASFSGEDSGRVYWESEDPAYGSGTYPIERLARPMLAECEPEE